MLLASLLGHTTELLATIRSSSKPADSLIDQYFRKRKYLGSHDRKFIAETTYGTLRHWRLCEWLVGDRAGHVSAHEKLLLTVAAYLTSVDKSLRPTLEALLPRERSPQLAGALSDLLASADRPIGTNGRSNLEHVALQYSFPDWMVDRFFRRFGEPEAAELCASLNQPAPLFIRVNTLKTSVSECREKLAQEGVETLPCAQIPFALTLKKRINVFALRTFKDGFFEVQDVGSQLIPFLLDPKPTAKILDACAGAGGKSLEFAALMKNRGEIVAVDIQKYRIEELRKRARRAGAFNIRTRSVTSLEDLRPDFDGAFDLVLVDAPCTGTGTIRRNPGMKWSVTEEMVTELSRKQLDILSACTTLVKPGGRLAYATCSLFDEENEDVVGRFLELHREFNIVPPPEASGAAGTGAMPALRTFPHRDGADGFFCAVMQR